MIEKYYKPSVEQNYVEAQERIKKAMQDHENYVYLPKETYKSQFKWFLMPDTLTRLLDDGFHVNELWDPEEYWSIEW